MKLDEPIWYARDLDPEELAFQRLYGPWDPMTLRELAELMAGFPAPWWVVGGHAIEAFTGVARHHEDVDLTLFAEHLPQLREHVGQRFHLWSAGGGALRPLDDQHPEPHPEAGQVWLREHALAPWRVDCILNPSQDGRWVSKRDSSHVAALDEVTWVAHDGIRYLNPEITLFFKANQARPKDEADLANAWPLMSSAQQEWLRDAVRRTYPNHPWHAPDRRKRQTAPMNIEKALEFVRGNHRAVIATRTADGGIQQSPVLVAVDAQGRLVVSSRETAYKTKNLRRDPWVQLCVLNDGFFGDWIYVEGRAEVVSLPEAMEPLVDYFRSISGEHSDWDDYRAAMRREKRVALRIEPERAGPDRHG